jgi:hypothetical protein
MIAFAKARLVKNEPTAWSQACPSQSQYFVNLSIGEVMKDAQRKNCIGLSCQLPDP